MTAAEKRKYLGSCILEFLAPYGFFFRYGRLWKYSLQGQYLIDISFDLTRDGALNEIDVCYGSFYAPFELPDIGKRMLLPGTPFALDMYIRRRYFDKNTRTMAEHPSIHTAYIYERKGPNQDEIWLNADATFMAQTEIIMPYFMQLLFPLLQCGDSLEDYLASMEKLVAMDCMGTEEVQGYTWYSVIEMAYAYLSLGKINDVQRVLQQYKSAHEKTIESVEHDGYYTEQQKPYVLEPLVKGYQRISALYEDMKMGDWKKHEVEMKMRWKTSHDLLVRFFHIKE